MIRFRCKQCGKKLKAEEEIVGRKVRCARCESVETVPPEDNLAKPESPKRLSARLATAEPNLIARSGGSQKGSSIRESLPSDSSDSFDSSSVLGDDSGPVSMFGHSSAGPAVVDPGQPRFKPLERKKVDFKRLVPAALVGLVLVGIVFLAINRGWIFGSGPRFDAEFEALPAVANYRRAQNQLEKSRRVMMVIGEALTAKKSVPDDMLAELKDFNESILKLSKKNETLDAAAKLVDEGEQAQANKLLTDEANIMDDQKLEVDRKTSEYNSLAY